MTNDAPWLAWLIAAIVTLGVLGLIAYAGGPKHHRGDEIGTHGTKIVVVRPG
jgi:hypothetical protein